MELFTERLKLKDIMPERAKSIAKEYSLEEDKLEFIRKSNPLNPEDIKIEDGERAAIRYINTADLDRDKEIVMPDGGLMKDFLKSPTVLYSHDYRGLPIGKDIWIKLIKGKGWLAKTIYANHQLASDVYNLVKEKFLNSSSIGFIPLESIGPKEKGWDKIKEKLVNDWSIPDDKVDEARRIITKWILLEHSDVPLASNINALNIAVGKGFEIKSKQLFDDLKIEIIDEEKEQKEIITKPEETEDYIHIRVRDPGDFQEDSFRTIDIDKGKGIKAVIGRLKGETTTTVQKYIFDKSKGWTMASAQAWVNDNKKEYEELNIEDEKEEIKEEKIETIIPKENNSIIELATKYGILLAEKTNLEEEIKKEINEIKIRDVAIKELETKIEEIELKQGAVLNRKNKTDLKDAQGKIQGVLDSAEPLQNENIEIEIEETKEEKKDELNIDINEIKNIINDAIKAQVNNVTDNLKEEINNNFKRITGKVM